MRNIAIVALVLGLLSSVADAQYRVRGNLRARYRASIQQQSFQQAETYAYPQEQAVWPQRYAESSSAYQWVRQCGPNGCQMRLMRVR